jgi:hypothetical protein
MVDAIRTMLGAIQTAGQDGEETYLKLIETLTHLQNQNHQPAAHAPPAPAAPWTASQNHSAETAEDWNVPANLAARPEASAPAVAPAQSGASQFCRTRRSSCSAR